LLDATPNTKQATPSTGKASATPLHASSPKFDATPTLNRPNLGTPKSGIHFWHVQLNLTQLLLSIKQLLLHTKQYIYANKQLHQLCSRFLTEFVLPLMFHIFRQFLQWFFYLLTGTEQKHCFV
jgi:hypothetical protein